LEGLDGKSEKDLAESWVARISGDGAVYPGGWYAPPPLGVGMLFGQAPDYSRTKFDNLRREEFWPREKVVFGAESVGVIYCSPVDKRAGIMGDFGMTVYTGNDVKIQKHIKSGLAVVEKTAEFAQAGMEFREVYNYSQNLLKQHGLNNDRTVGFTANITPKSIGHTIPFTYERPSESEQQIIDSQNFEGLKELLRTKRVSLDAKEKFKIPPNIAFITEIRAESNADKNLPSVYFHIIVTFANNKKEILTNFNEIIHFLKMDYIKSNQ
jgi:hypothetical protein